MHRPPRVAFIGWGAINSRVGALLEQRESTIEIVGIATRDTPEERAVAWWAELARVGRHRLAYHHRTARLVLPASRFPPPLMVERPLIWASAGPPGRESMKSWTYQAIEPERAAAVARILGMPREDK